MNKKIIAIAMASAMAAPAVMADVKISGRVGGELTFVPANSSGRAGVTGAASDSTKASREFSDFGSANRIQFDGSIGNAYARNAYNDANASRDGQRELLAGYKLSGGSSIQFGRMPTAAKNAEADPYITTFLQVRATAALVGTSNKYVSNSFVNGLIQYKTKMGGGNLTVQYDPTDNYPTGNSNHIAVALTGKAGGMNYFVAYNNGAATAGSKEYNFKIGGSMKMGSAKITLVVTDTSNASGNNKTTATAAWADFGMGNGLSVNVGYGANGDTGTWSRIAVNKKLNKGTNVFGGVVNSAPVSGTGATVFGAGMIVKF